MFKTILVLVCVCGYAFGEKNQDFPILKSAHERDYCNMMRQILVKKDELKDNFCEIQLSLIYYYFRTEQYEMMENEIRNLEIHLEEKFID